MGTPRTVARRGSGAVLRMRASCPAARSAPASSCRYRSPPRATSGQLYTWVSTMRSPMTVVVLEVFAAPDDARRDSRGDRTVGDVVAHDAVCADRTTLTDGHAAQDRHAIAEPRSCADSDRFGHDRVVQHVRVAVAPRVIAVDDGALSAEHHVVPDLDGARCTQRHP